MERQDQANGRGTSDMGEDTSRKSRRSRFKKLTGADLSGLPGAAPSVAKPTASEATYYISALIPVTGTVGTTAETSVIHDFALQLDAQAKAEHVGSVITISFSGASCEVVLKLDTPADAANPGAPVKEAFSKLGGLLTSNSLLTQDYSGKRASWKAKINGTTIAEGQY